MNRSTTAQPAPRRWLSFGIIALAAALALVVFVRANPQTVALDLEDATTWNRVYQVETSTEGEPFRWTRSRSRIILPFTAIGSHRMTLALQSGRAEPGAVPVTLDGPHIQQTIAVTQQPRRYHLLVNGPVAVGQAKLTLAAPTFPSPAPRDMRELGIVLRGGELAPLSGALPWCWLTAAALAVQPFLLYLLLRQLPRSGSWLRTILAALWLPLHLPWLLAWGYNDYVCAFALGFTIILAALVERASARNTAGRTESSAAAPVLAPHQRPLLRDSQARWVVFLATLVASVGTLFVLPQLPTMTITTGDEPHYLLLAHSLYADQDFDPLNNYLNEDWRRFYDGEELPSHVIRFATACCRSTRPWVCRLLSCLPMRWAACSPCASGSVSSLAWLWWVSIRACAAPYPDLSPWVSPYAPDSAIR
jgi:hypothetical protein